MRRRRLLSSMVGGMGFFAGCTASGPSGESDNSPDGGDTNAGSAESTETQTPSPIQIDTSKTTANGFPSLTMNYLVYGKGPLSSGDNQLESPKYIPHIANKLNVRSFYDGYFDFEEYQTEYAAKKRIEFIEELGYHQRRGKDRIQVSEVKNISGYPNQWLFVQEELDVRGITRIENVIFSGGVEKKKYTDPLDTLVTQLKTGEKPEAGGLPQKMMDSMETYMAEDFRLNKIDPSSHDSYTVPMSEASKSKARQIVSELTEHGEFDLGKTQIEDFPVDAQEAWNISDSVGQLEDTTGTIAIWKNTDWAKKFINSIIDDGTWSYNPQYREDDPRPLISFRNHSGRQVLLSFHRFGLGEHRNYRVMPNHFSGNVTITY